MVLRETGDYFLPPMVMLPTKTDSLNIDMMQRAQMLLLLPLIDHISQLLTMMAEAMLLELGKCQ